MPIISTMRATKAARSASKNPLTPLAPVKSQSTSTIDFTKLTKLEQSTPVDFTSLSRVDAPKQSYQMTPADESAMKDMEDSYKAGLISKREYEEELDMIKNPLDLGVETRGQGVQYHGTSSELQSLDDGFYTTHNIYGQGFYTTDAVDIARGYSRKGKGENPTIYKVLKKKDLNLYDMEKPLDDKLRRKIEDADIDTEGLTTLREVYDGLRNEEFMSADEVQEMFSSVAEILESDGFEGLRHVGGTFTNKKPHNVEIIFRPKQSLDIKKLRVRDNK